MMASWTGVIIFAVAIVLAIVIGEKFKKNSGLIALVFAFIIGCGFAGMRAKNVLSAFPIDTFYVIFIATFFYGFMSESGFVKGLSDRMIYACRNKPALIAPMTLLVTFVLSAMGANEAAMLIMAPLCFGLAIQMGYSPLLAIIAVQAGGSLGGYMPWAVVGAMQIGMFEGLFGSAAAGKAAQMGFAWTVLVLTLILFFGTYVITKGHKVNKPVIAPPEPFTAQQKKALYVLCGVLFCVVIVPLLSTIFPTPFFSKLTGVLDLRLVMTVGAIVAMFLKLGNEREVFSKRVPWSLIFMVCGMMTLISLATNVGTIEFVTGLVNEGLNPNVAVVLLFVVVCLLGAVTAGITVVSLLLALVVPLAAACGMPGYALMACGLCGIHGMSISPYSGGGAMALSGCPDEMRSSVIKKQYLIMVIQAILLLALTLIGVPEFFANLYV